MSRTPILKEGSDLTVCISKTAERIWDLADEAILSARVIVPFETQTAQIMQQIMQQLRYQKV
jgi:hypothetical protein